MTTIEQKETEVLASVKTDTTSALTTQHKALLQYDDMFNLKCEVGSEIRRLDYRINNQKSLMDAKAIEYQKLKEINGSNINSVKASFQGQETYSQQLSKIEWSVERMQYTLELLETKRQATVEFYETHIEKYVPYSSGKVKDLKNLQSKSIKGQEWLAKHNQKLPKVITGSELIPAIAE